MNWRRIVTRLFDRCVPMASSASRHFAIVAELMLVRRSRLSWLSPPCGLGGCLGLTNIVSHVVFARGILRNAVTHFVVGRRRKSVVRIQGRPIVRLTCGD